MYCKRNNHIEEAFYFFYFIFLIEGINYPLRFCLSDVRAIQSGITPLCLAAQFYKQTIFFQINSLFKAMKVSHLASWTSLIFLW